MIVRFAKKDFIIHPIATLEYLEGNKTNLHNIIILKTAKLFLKDKFNADEVKDYLNEIREGNLIPMNASKDGNKLQGNLPVQLFGKWLYVMVRTFKPDIMVETGVAHGVSSWNILNAMHKNGNGKLYSIDLPNIVKRKVYEIKQYNNESGWVIPDILRYRWELHLGSSEQLLPQLLQKLSAIDIFFHDSDHSYDNMKFEFGTAFQYLKPNGLIVSDDIHKNNSFEEFVNKNNLFAVQFSSKGGVAARQ